MNHLFKIVLVVLCAHALGANSSQVSLGSPILPSAPSSASGSVENVKSYLDEVKDALAALGDVATSTSGALRAHKKRALSLIGHGELSTGLVSSLKKEVQATHVCIHKLAGVLQKIVDALDE